MGTRLDPSFYARPFAHRGLHDRAVGRIENSMSAIHAAIDANFGIEIDIQLTRDQVPLVFHDYNLERLTDRGGFIREKDVSELSRVTLTGSDETIPTLSDVLNAVSGKVPLLVEIKDQDMRLGPDVGRIQSAVVHLLADYVGPVAVMSFNPHAIAAVAEQAPHLCRGLVTDAFLPDEWPTVPETRLKELAEIPDAKALDVDFVSHDVETLQSDAVSRLKADGLPIFCWTVKSLEQERLARQVADQITFEGFVPEV